MPNTQKMTIITKLAMHTVHDHNSSLKMEHLQTPMTRAILSDIFARCGQTISSLIENTLSTGAELTGTAKILSNKYPRAQITSGYKCLQALYHCHMSISPTGPTNRWADTHTDTRPTHYAYHICLLDTSASSALWIPDANARDKSTLLFSYRLR